ncbi:hypothetical protein TRFO_01400 [Tritrichomonas foetus]|uniref:SP-RING-type domain-containing protein n=1 Tax=Tritrichomonas foetus TaxID=1144522 RepID=A0A1J4K7P9_9EUKA|nr:hypothetical protein TRFO_01400 [Tritrichomonas foetus]|eukprot:OHT07227.1 hypothetical protein TRFO_01400 [Tritrichomonas foetus]
MNRRFSFNQERYNIGSSYNAFDQMLINHPETSSPGSFPKMNMNHQMNMMSIFPQPIIEERREIKFENYKFTDKPPTLPTVFIDGKFVDVNDIVQQIVYNRPPAPHIPNNEMLTNVCPLSFCPITCPSRGVFCLHSQCFDLRSFLLLQSDENWLCPICRTPITWNSLRYDPAFFLRIF